MGKTEFGKNKTEFGNNKTDVIGLYNGDEAAMFDLNEEPSISWLYIPF